MRAQLARTLVALGTETPQTLETLRNLIQDPMSDVRAAVAGAAQAFGRLPRGLRGPFLALLADRVSRVRTQAAQAIPQPELADAEIIDRLLGLLNESNPRVRGAAAAKLAEARRGDFEGDTARRGSSGMFRTSRALVRNPIAGAALLSAMEDSRPDVRAAACGLIPAFPALAGQSVPLLVVRLKDSDLNVRGSAARAIGQIRPVPEAAVRALLAIVASTNLTTQEAQQATIHAAGTLCDMGGTARARALRLLFGRLKAIDEAERQCAEQILAWMTGRINNELIRLLVDPGTPRQLQTEAVALLCTGFVQEVSPFSPDTPRRELLAAVPTLRALAMEDPEDQIGALALLAAIDPSDAGVAEHYLQLLRSDENKELEDLANVWFAHTIRTPMIPTLVQGLRDKDSSMRFATAKLLAGLAEVLADQERFNPGLRTPPDPRDLGNRRELETRMVQAFLPCLHDREFRVRWVAAESLGVLHAEPKRVIPALLAMARTEGGRLPSDGLTFHHFHSEYQFGRSDKGVDALRLAPIRALGGFGGEAALRRAGALAVPGRRGPSRALVRRRDPGVDRPGRRAAVPALIDALRLTEVATGAEDPENEVMREAPIRLIAAHGAGGSVPTPARPFRR